MAKTQTTRFIYHFDPIRPELVTNPDAWTEEDLRIGEAHFEYLKRATADGTVILAGRSLDGEGPALVIFEAESEETARRFMENDPFVSGGLMRATLHPFRVALVRKSSNTAPLVDPRQLQQQHVKMVLGFCNKSANAIPAEKADWKPQDGNAKSALEIVRHMVEVNRAIASSIASGESLSEPQRQQIQKETETYDQALQALNNSSQTLCDAYDAIPAASLKQALQDPTILEPPLRQMGVGLIHLTYHWGQLCYLQTLWGDQEDHFLK